MFTRFDYLIDGDTPRDTQLAPIYRKSPAYYCLKDDLPVVVTNIIDTLSKDKDEIVKKYGLAAQNDIKNVIAKLSKIKYEMQTDKSFLKFEENDPDLEKWNHYIEKLPERKKTFYGATWLDAECYLYRKIFAFFTSTAKLKQFDYFEKMKQAKVRSLIPIFNFLVDQVAHLPESKESLLYLFQLNIWSHIIEAEFSSKDPGALSTEIIGSTLSNAILKRTEYLLINDVEKVWNCLKVLSESEKSAKVVHIILEDCGLQLFSSFLIANFLIDKGLATNVTFHPKAYPYRTTEATCKDIEWFIGYLSKTNKEALKSCAKTWSSYFKQGTFKNCKDEFFWTMPYPFFRMGEESSDLFSLLKKGRLIIVCGDLNYRKLLGDFTWDMEQEFITCLRGFRATNLVALRAIATPIVCGIGKSLSLKIANISKDWLTNREYGLIQFCCQENCTCSHGDLPTDDYFDIVTAPSATCSEKFARLNINTEKQGRKLESEPTKVVAKEIKTIKEAPKTVSSDGAKKKQNLK